MQTGLILLTWLFHSTFSCHIMTGAPCIAFSFSGDTYQAGQCRYDYLHEFSWCVTEFNAAGSLQAWGRCQMNSGCTTDYKDCSVFQQKSDGKFYHAVYAPDQRPENYAASRQYCREKGAVMAHADNAATFDVIKSIINDHGGNEDKFFIGLWHSEITGQTLWRQNNASFEFPVPIHRPFGSSKQCPSLMKKHNEIGIEYKRCDNPTRVICQIDYCSPISQYHGQYSTTSFGAWDECSYNYGQWYQYRTATCVTLWSPDTSGVTCDPALALNDFRACIEAYSGLKCIGDENCCTEENPCKEGDGTCTTDQSCEEDLACGSSANCHLHPGYFDESHRCCGQRWSGWNQIEDCELGLDGAPNAAEYFEKFNRSCLIEPCDMDDSIHFEFCEPVNGNWSDWGDWSSCDSEQCTRRRNRSCNNPEPEYGGDECEGNSIGIQICEDCSPSCWELGRVNLEEVKQLQQILDYS